MFSFSERFIKVIILISMLWIAEVGAAAESKVRVAIPSESMAQIAFYVGLEKDYYKEEGLDVELILMGAPVANLSLIGGDVDFSTVPAAALTAAVRGAPLRVVYSTFYRPMHWLYAKPHISQHAGVKEQAHSGRWPWRGDGDPGARNTPEKRHYRG
jgi:ABC-type nitrate/sulfonate/bicarbonate transport system substrate-binding protein